MKLIKALITITVLNFSLLAHASFLPGQPTDESHPGSANYAFNSKYEKIQINGRSVEVFLPQALSQQKVKVPAIVFGHGQAITVEGYKLTFEHLAKKGVAVIFPFYDKGFFDQDWRRMGSDFNQLAAETIKKYSDVIDATKIVYSGHSKGGYVALMAAGAPNVTSVNLGSVLVFEPAGFDAEWIKNINKDVAVTVTWADGDTVTDDKLIKNIYESLIVNHKQFIQVNSYPDLKADHYFVMSKSYFFGGKDGASAFHFYGAWKWLLGSVWDFEEEAPYTNQYLYGVDTKSTGVSDLSHLIIRNW